VVTPARVIAAICVVAPFVAVLYVPTYDKDKPEVAGFPFFFWWQLLWVAITAGLMGLAYFVVRREELARKGVVATGTTASGAFTESAEAPEKAEATETAEDTTEDSTEEGDSE